MFVLPTAVVFWVLLELGAARKVTVDGAVVARELENRMKALRTKTSWILKWFGWSCGIGLLLPALKVAVVKFMPPPTLPMTARWLAGRFNPAYQANQYHWVGLSQVPETFLTGVWVAEDNKFFAHWGFDWEQIQLARAKALASGRPPRGASTITQQCARSLFLWPGRSWLRKGLEAYYTVWMELLLSKSRILELYSQVNRIGHTWMVLATLGPHGKI